VGGSYSTSKAITSGTANIVGSGNLLCGDTAIQWHGWPNLSRSGVMR